MRGHGKVRWITSASGQLTDARKLLKNIYAPINLGIIAASTAVDYLVGQAASRGITIKVGKERLAHAL